MLYIGINVAIFVVVAIVKVVGTLMGYGDLFGEFVDYHLAFPSSSWQWATHFYTIFTYQFIHADFFHLLFNMLWLYWIGQLLLDFIKPRQFHFIYILSGVCGALFFALIYNLVPIFNTSGSGILVGASAAVAGVFAALTTLTPNYNLHLMFIGNVKIKYLFIVYLFINLIGITSANAGGSLSHLGGVLFGFAYVKILQNGTDISSIFKKKPKLKVVRNENQKKSVNKVNQKEIDAILDKISKAGYDKLSKEEKEILFRASKN